MAAQVLSHRINEVVLLDRDPGVPPLTETAVEAAKVRLLCMSAASTLYITHFFFNFTQAAGRHGVAQYHHLHILLAKGSLVMDEIFPGFINRLHNEGVPECIPAQDVTHLLPGVGALPCMNDVAPEVKMQLATRHLIESILRDFVSQNTNVKSAFGKKASNLLLEDGRVCGVQLSDGSALTSDMVVDCMGMSSHIADWLAGHSYNKPETSTLSADVCYTCRQVFVAVKTRDNTA